MTLVDLQQLMADAVRQGVLDALTMYYTPPRREIRQTDAKQCFTSLTAPEVSDQPPTP